MPAAAREVRGIANLKGRVVTLLSLDASVRLQREATELCRAKKGYLSGKQIKAVRERAGYSQEELERLIKAGPKSFTRWEKGTALQKGPTDVLLRILDRFPIVVEWLQGSTPSLGQKHIEVAPAHNTPVASESDKGLAA